MTLGSGRWFRAMSHYRLDVTLALTVLAAVGVENKGEIGALLSW